MIVRIFVVLLSCAACERVEVGKEAPYVPPPPPAEPLRIATIDLDGVFAGYYRTREAESEINRQKAEAKRDLDRRNARYRELISRYQSFVDGINDPATIEEDRLRYQNEARAIASEARAIERKKKEVSGRRQRELTLEVELSRDELLSEICDLVGTTARMWNYDMVLDRSGVGERGIPFILYTGENTIDITEDTLSTLNLDVPVGGE